MKNYEVVMTGKTALLMHNDSVTDADRLKDWRRKNKSTEAGDDRYPSFTWKTYLYSDDERKFLALPAANIMACLRTAGAKKIMKKNTTYKTSTQTDILICDAFDLKTRYGSPVALESIAQISDDEPFSVHEEAVAKLGFSLDVRRARIGTSKHVRVRPYFARGWKATGMITVTDEVELPYDVIKDIFNIAGSVVGIGDYRPGCKTPGMYGRFDVEIIPR